MEENKRVGRRLRILNNLVRRQIDKSCTKKQIDDMTGTNGWIIGYIARNSDKPIYQRDLEREFGITRSTASKVVILMEKKGFIRHEAAPHDARLKQLLLTERSREIVSMMEEGARHTEKKLTAGFSDNELEELRSYLDRMIKNMEE
jgi:DNA-binding MarR family transcriptional regulator